MSNLSKGARAFVKGVAVLTAVTTVLSLSGFAFVGVLNVDAATPADYGLTEGDTISADGTPGSVGYDPDIYIVNDWGYKRLFLNPAIFNFYGHLGGFAAVKTVSPATRDAFPTSGLFRNCEAVNDQRVWGVEVTAEDNGILHWVNTTGAQAVQDDPNFFLKVFCINNNEFAWYPKGSDYTSVNQVPDYNRGTPSQSPTPTPSPSGLNGSAGSLANADFVGSLNNEEVGEGENNVAVTGLDLEADNGSDLRLLSVRVALEEDGTAASEDLDDYADEVSVWFDGNEVGSVDVSDMSEDTGVWSQSISLTGSAIIRMDQTEQLRVAVSALGNLDSVDLANNQWEIAIEHVRYVDAQGAITTETTLDDIGTLTAGNGGASDRPFRFVDFASAADLELNLNEASDNPDSRVVDVDDTDTTDNIVLVTGNLEASGGDIEVKELTVNIASTGADFRDIADSLSLEVDGDVRQTLQSTECSAAGVCVFDDVDEAIAEDDTVKIRVLADINGTEDYVEGATLTATINNSNTDAEDQNGDALAGGDLTGTANGEAQAFYSEGIMVTFVSATEVVTTNDAAPDLGTFTIKFNVRAFDTAAYVRNDCETGGADANGQGVEFNVTGSATVNSCIVEKTEGDNATAAGNFEVLEDANRTFSLVVAVEGDADFVSVAMESINWNSSDSLAAGMNDFYTFNMDDFKTDSVYLSDL